LTRYEFLRHSAYEYEPIADSFQLSDRSLRALLRVVDAA
jgi:hypothetical protein